MSDSPEQTRAVLLAHAQGTPAPLDLVPWHDLQRWLAMESPAVEIGYLVTLARAIPPVAVRLRRDFPAVVSLIRAHALLHQLSRERDADGAVLATIEDYAVVRDLVADLVADAAERSVSATTRETVGHIAPLTEGGTETTAIGVAKALGLDKSAGWRRVRSAIDRGYVRNLEERRGRPARLIPGDALPDDQAILPEPADLERLHGCTDGEGDTKDAGDDVATDLLGLARAIFGDSTDDEPPIPVYQPHAGSVLDDDGLPPFTGPIQ